MRKFKTDILIRNNRLKIMQDNGLQVEYQILSDDDYIRALKAKLVEEAKEVAESNHLSDIKNELADVLEVFEHLLDVYRISLKEIENIKLLKQRSIGKFDKKIKTISVSMKDDHEELSYYLSKPHKYPEIK